MTKSNKKILLLDFDGVIHKYSSGWKGARNIPDQPVSGALEFIVEATEHFDVCIYSARSSQFGGIQAMKKWLYDKYAEIGEIKRTGWPSPFRQFDEVDSKGSEIPRWYSNGILNETSMEPWEYEVDQGVKRFLKKIMFPKNKPAAFLTIDDRCFLFKEQFPSMEEISNFKPWYHKQ